MKKHKQQIKTTAAIRILVITILFASSLFTVTDESPLNTHLIFYLFSIAYLFNIIYLYLVRIERLLEFINYFQFIADQIIITLLVYFSEGIISPLTSLYTLTVISAGVTLPKKGSFFITASASIILGLIGNIQYHEMTSHMPVMSGKELLSSLLPNILGFFILWKLCSDLILNLHTTGAQLEEKQLGFAQLKSFHENIVNSMSGGLLTTDLSGTITSFNKAAEKITGYNYHEVIKHACWDFFNWPEIKEIFAKPNQLEGSRRIDREFKKADGTDLHLGVTISSLRDKTGNPTGIIGIFQDLTKIKKMEEEIKKKERLALIGELAANVAHEIRNPLASLSGSMQILKESLQLNDQEELLINIALREADRLNGIITEFLSYAGPFKLNKQPYDIDNLLRESLALLKNHPLYKGITLVEDMGAGGFLVDIDIDRMKQVFWNLALNAIEATPKGGRLEIKTRIKSDKNGLKKLDILFSDTGTGILEENLNDIFTPFYTTKESGSGLGLSIAARIIEEHGGEIRASDRADTGTEFLISIPARQVTANAFLADRLEGSSA